MLQAIQVEDFKPLVTECFSSDPNYLQFHYLGEHGLDACIQITVDELKSASGECLYKVVDDEEIIAMFGVEDGNILNPFFIKPKFRKKEYVGPLLDLVRSKLNKTYYIGLYDRNEPIIKFFLKNGGTIKATGVHLNKPVTILGFENGSR